VPSSWPCCLEPIESLIRASRSRILSPMSPNDEARGGSLTHETRDGRATRATTKEQRTAPHSHESGARSRYRTMNWIGTLEEIVLTTYACCAALLNVCERESHRSRRSSRYREIHPRHRDQRLRPSKEREDLEQDLVRNHRHRRLIDQRSNHRHRRHGLLDP